MRCLVIGLSAFLLFLISSPAQAVVTFNSADKDAGITLSNGDNTATGTSGGSTYPGVRCTEAIGASAKVYYEFLINDFGTAGTEKMFGIGQSGTSLAQNLGADATGYAWGRLVLGAYKYNNGSFTALGNVIATNDVVKVAVDMNAGKIWFGDVANGWWEGNPAAGTGESFGSISGTYYPQISLKNGVQVTFRSSADDCSGTLPSGFSYLNEEAAGTAQIMIIDNR